MTVDQVKYDSAREEELKMRGITIVRFNNSEVINETNIVIDKITTLIGIRLSNH